MVDCKIIARTRHCLISSIAIIALAISVVLMAINLYGLTQSIRMPGLDKADPEDLRFSLQEGLLSYQESIDRIEGLALVSDYDAFVNKASDIVKMSLVHLDWERVDPVKYRQLIPVWENYFLYSLGLFSGMPQIERYHYSDYRRNLRRGIGICGDASTILSSILDQYGIENEIVSFDGHVLVQYFDENGLGILIDPDFGVSLGVALQSLSSNLDSVSKRYRDEGYSDREIDYLFDIYKREYVIFDDTYHFMSKRYIFEYVSYYLKWLIPTIGLVVSLMLFRWLSTHRKKV